MVLDVMTSNLSSTIHSEIIKIITVTALIRLVLLLGCKIKEFMGRIRKSIQYILLFSSGLFFLFSGHKLLTC